MPLAPSLDTIGWFARDIDLYDRVGSILLGDDAREFRLTQLLYMPVLEQLLLGREETDAYRTMFSEVRPHFSTLKAASQPTLSIDELYLAFRHIQGAEARATHGGWISSGDRKLGPGVADRFAFGRESPLISLPASVCAGHNSRRN